MAIRKKKYLLALQASLRAAALVGKESPEVHRMIVILGKEVLPAGSASLNGHAKVSSQFLNAVTVINLTCRFSSLLGRM